MTRWIALAVGVLGGAFAVWRMATEDYRSEALLCVSPTAEAFHGEDWNALAQIVMSRKVLRPLMEELEPYAAQPLEDSKARTRFKIQDRCLKVTFANPDRWKAQRGLERLTRALREAAPQWRMEKDARTEAALVDLLEDAAHLLEHQGDLNVRPRVKPTFEIPGKDRVAWDAIPRMTVPEQNAALAPRERAESNLAFARQRYADLREKLSEFRLAQRLAERTAGEAIREVEGASLPAERWEKEHRAWAMAAGGVGGALSASLAAWGLQRILLRDGLSSDDLAQSGERTTTA